ncbi:hypothetical protein CK203_085418 [Vitis vinifera]|uniref:Uncharacterized protein n=1 Tax=Vitis vinifera TaxID=29760 RepID=A0A438E4I2_VITVI|nr:hypothetical protein CK203_085418 [Vitis vinifera]
MLPPRVFLHSLFISFVCTSPMEIFTAHNASIPLLLSLLIFISSFVLPGHALSPAGTIERSTKQQVLASLPPSHETTQLSGSSQLFLTSPSGRYEAFLLRRETSFGAGGFGNDFCYIQVQEGGRSVWESECASVSNINTCTLLFSDAGLEIFDGSRSAWDSDADGDHLQMLDLLDAGDMQIRDEEGELAWKASDNPVVNQNCGSIGAPGLAPETPPFATPIEEKTPFGQDQQQQPQLGDSQQGLTQPLSAVNQPFSTLNQPLGVNINQQGLVDNTPYDSGAQEERKLTTIIVIALVSLISLMAALGLLI